MGKNLPAMQETRVQSLAWEDPSGEGNGNPLQQPCLENLGEKVGATFLFLLFTPVT